MITVGQSCGICTHFPNTFSWQSLFGHGCFAKGAGDSCACVKSLSQHFVTHFLRALETDAVHPKLLQASPHAAISFQELRDLRNQRKLLIKNTMPNGTHAVYPPLFLEQAPIHEIAGRVFQ